MQNLQIPLLQSGQHVDARGESWLVVGAERFARAGLVIMRGIGDENRGEICRLLTPFDRVQLLCHRTGITRASRQGVLQNAAINAAASPRWSDCWTAGAARIELRSWQLDPALAAISGMCRILLADEVGLGKTIQSALIVSELLARGLAKRVLVLTPASLRDQWAAEFADKFGLTATVVDHASLSAAVSTLPPDVNPWKTAPLTIASIDLVKRPEVRAAVDEVAFDILVVDEAHHLTPGTDRGAVVSDIAARTLWVVMATATPHSGDEAAYQFLCGIGGASPLLRYRRSAADLRTTIGRRVRFLSVTPTSAERDLLDGAFEYGKRLWARSADRPELRLVAAVIARRAASLAAAAGQTLRRRLALIRGESRPSLQALLPWDEGDADAEIDDHALGIKSGLNESDEITWLEHLIQLADTACLSASKIAAVRKLLRRTHEPLLLFSEYRDVVLAVAAQLSDVDSVVVIHGGLPGSTRTERIRAFTQGRVRVLSTTDAAGEGLNLHQRCRLVVNLDLPWNPSRLEQRIGRLDRLGQQRRVHAINLFHRGSFEDTVRARLHRRWAQAGEALQHTDVVVRDELAAAHVFADRAFEDVATGPRSQPSALIVGSDAFAAMERRLLGLTKPSGLEAPRSRPLYTPYTQGKRPFTHVVLLFRSDLVDEHGRLIQRELIPLLCEVGSRCGWNRRLTKELVERLIETHVVRSKVSNEVNRRAATTRSITATSALGIEQRVSSLLAGIERRRGNGWLQGSLFDRRAEQRRQARHDTIRIWQEHLIGQLAVARALTSLQASEPQLIAAWPTSSAEFGVPSAECETAFGTPHSALSTPHSAPRIPHSEQKCCRA